jgi:hypothetical protein
MVEKTCVSKGIRMQTLIFRLGEPIKP